MSHINDALELLTAQHEELDFLVVQVQQTYDADAFEELATKLVAHLALEQELFYPAITSVMTVDVQRELLTEHAAIKRVLAEMLWLGVEDCDFGGKLHELAYLLDGHAGYQEDELFEHVAESLPSDELVSLGVRLHSFDTEILIAA